MSAHGLGDRGDELARFMRRKGLLPGPPISFEDNIHK
jgi:hypothetical protein